jgi:hypothetical protein
MKWTKGMDMGFEAGQTVYAFGCEGKVRSIHNSDYPIYVECESGDWCFKKDGRYLNSHEAPSLFHNLLTYEVELPKYEPKKGDVVWMRLAGDTTWQVMEIIKFKDGVITYISIGSSIEFIYLEHNIEMKPFKGELP